MRACQAGADQPAPTTRMVPGRRPAVTPRRPDRRPQLELPALDELGAPQATGGADPRESRHRHQAPVSGAAEQPPRAATDRDDRSKAGRSATRHHAAASPDHRIGRATARPAEPVRRRVRRGGELLERGGQAAVHPGGRAGCRRLVLLARAPRRRGAPGRPGRPGRRAPARRPRRPGAAAGPRCSSRSARRCPSPVRAETTTAPGSGLAQPGRTSSSAHASALLTTTSSGTCGAPISPSTSRTAAIWPFGSGSEPSTTCRIRSASATSSSVERNASTSWCGRWRTKPTVSVSVYSRPSGVSRPAHGRVEGGEQRVLDQHAGAGEPVEQRRLAGVGVAGDRDGRHLVARRSWPLGVPRRASCRRSRGAAWRSGRGCAAGRSRSWSHRDRGCRCRRRRRPGHRPAGTATHPSRAAAAACTAAGPARPGPCPPGCGVLGEDVEDQRGPVDDLDLDDLLEVAQLAGGQLTVADHGVGAGRRTRSRSSSALPEPM